MKSNIMLTVLKKELTDIFRDKKTVIMSIVIPLILFPIIFFVMGKSIDNTTSDVEKNLSIMVIDKDNSSLSQYIKSQKNVKIVENSNVEEAIKDGKALIAIEIPSDFDNNVKATEAPANIKIYYDNSSQKSGMAMDKVNALIDGYSKQIVAERLIKRNINVQILNPITPEIKSVVKESEGMGKMMLSIMLPLLLVIYCISGPMAPALDLGAGEKERGTLEPLLTTQAGRMSLLWGKFLAITIMGLLTSVASLGGLFIAMRQNNSLFTGGEGNVTSSLSLDPKALILIGLVTVLTTMVFGALELSISIYARSFKEAQTYVSPLMIIGFIPVYATYMLDVKNIQSFYFHIPLANVSCLIKEFISGIYNYNHIFITFGWTIVYILISIVLARFMFSREEVVFRT